MTGSADMHFGNVNRDVRVGQTPVSADKPPLIEAVELVKTYAMGDQTVHALRGVCRSPLPRGILWPSWGRRARASPRS